MARLGDPTHHPGHCESCQVPTALLSLGAYPRWQCVACAGTLNLPPPAHPPTLPPPSPEHMTPSSLTIDLYLGGWPSGWTRDAFVGTLTWGEGAECHGSTGWWIVRWGSKLEHGCVYKQYRDARAFVICWLRDLLAGRPLAEFPATPNHRKESA